MSTYKRLDLTEYELNELLYAVKAYEEQGNQIPKDLAKKLNNAKEIKRSVKKIVSAHNATNIRKKKAIKSIKLAIDYIERNNLKMTYTAIAKAGKVSPITVKKYIDIKDGKAITNQNFYYANLL